MKKSIVLSLLIVLSTITYSQDKNDSDNEKLANIIANESTYYGLIVGINHYRDSSIADLNNPIIDAEKLHSILTSSYSFKDENIMLLKDATRAEFIMSLDELTRVVTSNDNVLIFYAGHGLWDMEAQIGYWLPSDADRDTKVNWFPDSQLLDYLRTIKSKHTLLIVDASFSGSIFKTRSAVNNSDPDLAALFEQPSRKAMTSCSLAEASDNGIFIRYLIQGLSKNEEICLSSEKLFGSFRMDVISNGSDIPQYGEISNTGDKGGDFIFLKSK